MRSYLLTIKILVWSALIGVSLAGCNDDNGTGTGTLSLSVTDGAVDSASEVWVRFTGVSIKPQGGDQIDITFDQPKDVDLLTLSGGDTSALLDGEVLAAGPYNWIRLHVSADLDGTLDSYVMTDVGAMVELEVTSQTGLQLVSGFTITQNQNTSFVVDWDLRRGLTAPANQEGWRLTPALRVIDETEYGSISGTVDESFLMDASCTNDLAADTGNAVYIFEGADVTPDDIDQGDVDPVATGPVQQDQNGLYAWSINYLSPGDYTVSLTCQALDDDAESDDDIAFAASQNASVNDGEDTTVDFNQG